MTRRTKRPADRDETDRIKELVSSLWTPQWICPNCGRPFSNRYQPHACGQHVVRKFLEGHSPKAVALYRRFSQIVRACGPALVVPTKTRIGFQSHGVFASIDSLTAHGMTAHVILPRRLGTPRFTRIEARSPATFLHHFHVGSVDELDDEVAGWLREAYRVGEQAARTTTPRRRATRVRARARGRRPRR